MRRKFKVKNLVNGEIRFWDSRDGRFVYIPAGESVITECPPESSWMFEVEELKEKKKNKQEE